MPFWSCVSGMVPARSAAVATVIGWLPGVVILRHSSDQKKKVLFLSVL